MDAGDLECNGLKKEYRANLFTRLTRWIVVLIFSWMKSNIWSSDLWESYIFDFQYSSSGNIRLTRHYAADGAPHDRSPKKALETELKSMTFIRHKGGYVGSHTRLQPATTLHFDRAAYCCWTRRGRRAKEDRAFMPPCGVVNQAEQFARTCENLGGSDVVPIFAS